MLQQFPNSVILYNVQGAANAGLEQLDSAIISYKQALKIRPDYAEAHNNLGNVLKDKGDLAAAIDSYKQALKISPDYAEAHNNLGNVLKDKGDLAAAIDSYKQALKIRPDLAEAHYNMGKALKDKGELDAAIESFKQALKIRPDYAEAHNNLGNVLKDKGELDAAIDSYKQALKIRPNYTEAFVNWEAIKVQIFGSDKTNIEPISKLSSSLQTELLKNAKYLIYRSIFQFMLGNFDLSKESLSRYRELFEAGRTRDLKERDQMFLGAYNAFISHLIENNSFTTNSNLPKIYHIGESHCLSYAHCKLAAAKNIFSILPRITFGAKAYHFSESQENIFKAITRRNLGAIPNGSLVLISIGEIDCRAKEGIIKASEKTGKHLEQLVHKTVEGYVSWFREANTTNNHTYHFFNVPAPGYSQKDSKEINDKVAEVVALFNSSLKSKLSDYMIDMIDVYEQTKNENGFSNELYHCDDRHLDDRILEIVENQFDR